MVHVYKRKPIEEWSVKPSVWTAELIERLRELHAEGLGPTAIAEKFGFTKNQICGQVNRLGLRNGGVTKTRAELRAEAILRKAGELPDMRKMKPKQEPRTVTRKYVQGKPIPVAVPKDITVPDSNPFVGLLRVQPQAEPLPAPKGGCMFPLWPNDADFRHEKFGLFCGDPRLSVRTAYCETHFRRCVSRVIPSSAGLPPPLQYNLRL